MLEGIPAIVLFGPLLFPIAKAAHVNEVHYAMVVILAMGIGLFAPPLGVGYYAACAIGQVSPDAGMRRIWPYLGALLVGLVAVAAIPWLSTGFLKSCSERSWCILASAAARGDCTRAPAGSASGRRRCDSRRDRTAR